MICCFVSYSSLSASVILARTIFTAGMAVPMRTVHSIMMYTTVEMMRKCSGLSATHVGSGCVPGWWGLMHSSPKPSFT